MTSFRLPSLSLVRGSSFVLSSLFSRSSTTIPVSPLRGEKRLSSLAFFAFCLRAFKLSGRTLPSLRARTRNFSRNGTLPRGKRFDARPFAKNLATISGERNQIARSLNLVPSSVPFAPHLPFPLRPISLITPKQSLLPLPPLFVLVSILQPAHHPRLIAVCNFDVPSPSRRVLYYFSRFPACKTCKLAQYQEKNPGEERANKCARGRSTAVCPQAVHPPSIRGERRQSVSSRLFRKNGRRRFARFTRLLFLPNATEYRSRGAQKLGQRARSITQEEGDRDASHLSDCPAIFVPWRFQRTPFAVPLRPVQSNARRNGRWNFDELKNRSAGSKNLIVPRRRFLRVRDERENESACVPLASRREFSLSQPVSRYKL